MSPAMDSHGLNETTSLKGIKTLDRALIAMSGGVDSSVAALLTAREGFRCIGCTMRLYDNADAGVAAERGCCSLDDVEDARSVCLRLGMPFYAFNFTEDFRREVMAPFVESYRRGLTPNPCIECNRSMKFAKLLRRAEELGCVRLVTGHYARVEGEGERWVLKKALDENKDQSYVLYMLTQEQLEKVRFPLGRLTKTQVRAIAAENGFINAAKPDSQDICFVPDGNYSAVIERFTGEKTKPGLFVDRDGRALGEHMGIEHYTVGQRRGLGVSFGEPMYVVAVRPEDNTVVLGPNEALFSRKVFVPDFHWISGEPPSEPLRGKAKIRYRHREQPVTVYPTAEGGVKLLFDEPQRAPTPGQAAVLYDGDIVLGGGTIARILHRKDGEAL